MVKKRLRPGTDVSGVSDEATRVSELPIYGRQCENGDDEREHGHYTYVLVLVVGATVRACATIATGAPWTRVLASLLRRE